MNVHLVPTVALLILVSPHALADDADACEKASGEARIAACTRVIESGEWEGAKLAWANNNRGNARRSKGDLKGALADYNRAIELNPDEARAYAGRAGVKKAKNDLKGAIVDYSRAIELAPRNPNLYLSRGITHFFRRQFELAATDFVRVQELEEDAYAVLWLYLARKRSGVDGRGELQVNIAKINPAKWPTPILTLYLGKSTPRALLKAARHVDPKIQGYQLCEANFYLAEWYLSRKDRQKALPLLRVAAAKCPGNFVERDSAVFELKRLGNVKESPA